MKQVCAVVTILACGLAGIQFFETLLRAESAPQQASGMAVAIALVVIPYVFTRSVEILSSHKLSEKNDEIIRLLRSGGNSIEDKARKYDAIEAAKMREHSKI
jgi:hypothetical protein